MPFETPFGNLFAGTITATVHEHDAPPGAPPLTIIRTDQDWAVNVSWETTGLATGMITGNWHLHCFLESIGTGADLDLIDPGPSGGPSDHVIPLKPGTSPVPYFVHFDVPAGRVNIPDPVPPAGRLYRLVVSLTYREPTGGPGPMAGFVEGPILQFYQP